MFSLHDYTKEKPWARILPEKEPISVEKKNPTRIRKVVGAVVLLAIGVLLFLWAKS